MKRMTMCRELRLGKARMTFPKTGQGQGSGLERGNKARTRGIKVLRRMYSSY